MTSQNFVEYDTGSYLTGTLSGLHHHGWMSNQPFEVTPSFPLCHFLDHNIHVLDSRLVVRLPVIACPRFKIYLQAGLKGTQEWEFFWLQFWILYYLIVSYVKILQKNFLIGPILEKGKLGLRGVKKNFELGQKNIYLFFLFMNPLCELILVFSKFDPLTAPGMSLCVNLGPKCQNLFCLVWD